MSVAHWINKATDTQPGYVLIIAFIHQQWIQEGATMLFVVILALSAVFIACILY
jgi:hypothetical protein